MQITFVTLFAFIILTLSCNDKKENDSVILGKEIAENELKETLSDSTVHNVIESRNLLIKDKETAIVVVEPILFTIYSKDNILDQRPYESYLINNYWVISGTLRKGYKGGTFLIIIDARNSKVIRITHGK